MLWAEESDVVVVGFGAAGATAAITAHDMDASVIMLEKTQTGGGNTAASAGAFVCAEDLSGAIEHISALSSGSTPRDIIERYVHESSRNVEWLKSLGANIESRGGASLPQVTSSSAIKTYRVQGHGNGGETLWEFLKQQVQKRHISVLVKTPARELIQDDRGKIIGIVGENAKGRIAVRARRAVILACGGFEYDDELKKSYLPGGTFYAFGDPANTGDGIRMSQKVGADIWHMNAVAGPLGHKFNGFEAAFPANLARQSASDPFAYAFIYVDKEGSRFVDELSLENHLMWSAFVYFDPEKLEFPRIPSYIIFDESVRQAGPIVRDYVGNNRHIYSWSKDNTVEISKSWIESAPSIAELAQKIGIERELLTKSVEDYNVGCHQKNDFFGRDARSLVAIEKPPFYAISTYPCLLNTQGGPRRNADSQILDPFGKPIPGLYGAGELGSIWGSMYQAGGNLGECLAFGRIAGKNAAQEQTI